MLVRAVSAGEYAKSGLWVALEWRLANVASLLGSATPDVRAGGRAFFLPLALGA